MTTWPDPIYLRDERPKANVWVLAYWTHLDEWKMSRWRATNQLWTVCFTQTQRICMAAGSEPFAWLPLPPRPRQAPSNREGV